MLGGIEGRRRRGRQRMRWLDGITDSMDIECEWTLRVGDGQGGLVCCDSWGYKESDRTEWLNWLTDWLGFSSMKLFACIALTNSGEDISYCIYKCCPHPILSLTFCGTQFAYTVDVFISPVPHIESSLVFPISLFPSTEISSYLLFILLSFSLIISKLLLKILIEFLEMAE